LTEVFYRQCVLIKNIENSYLETTSYIPEPFCKVGRILKLKDEDGTWDDGWKVISAGERTPGRLVGLYSQSYKKTRKASDI
jgi:hypothetical protein